MIKFDSQYHLYDVTPLENMFIQQYMVKSPGDYVKVYVYCLNMCYFPSNDTPLTYEGIATALKLNAEDVQRAVRYWCRLGIMSAEDFDGNLEIEMHSVKDMFLRCEISDNLNLYKFAEFNNELSDAFAPRILDTQDYLLYQDMITMFEVTEQYITEAVRYAVKTAKSVDIPYKYVERIIEAWKNDGINTVESLKTYLEKRDSTYKELCTILRYLGMNRAPTIPELNYYKKWTDEYNFSFDAIKEACNQTVSANNPTIKYLDSILMGLRDKNVSTPGQIAHVKEKSDNYRTKVRKLLFYLGIPGAPSAAHVQKYTKWETDYRFTEDAITVAASMIEPGKNPFDSLDRLLESFHMNNINSADDMLVYANKKHEYDEDIKNLKSLFGDSSEIRDAQRNYIRRWREEYGLSIEVILFAAAVSANADKPWAYMDKVLGAWHSAGITTVEAAEAQMAQGKSRAAGAAQPRQTKKEYSFTKMDSHEYSEEDFANMFDDLSGMDKK